MNNIIKFGIGAIPVVLSIGVTEVEQATMRDRFIKKNKDKSIKPKQLIKLSAAQGAAEGFNTGLGILLAKTIIKAL